MNPPVRILLIHEDASQREGTLAVLRRTAPEAEVLQAGTGLDYAQRVREGAFEIAIAPVTLSWGDGSEVLTKVRQYSPDCLTILVGETQVARGRTLCARSRRPWRR